ncbi:MAG: SDR family oxidoreductase [Eudoraea sp.]|nr:SDR family oxidoreductase [Eudoraea sp.]
MNRAIGVMGCGWLGLPLAKALLNKNHRVYGSTTSEAKLQILKHEGIVPFKIVLGEKNIQGAISAFLAPLEVLIINVPPKLRGKGQKENYVRKMKLLKEAILKSGIKKMVFVSSTSVYGNVEGEVTEKTATEPVTESGKQLLASEELFRNSEIFQTAILRFGGLIGPERHPITFLAGRDGLDNGDEYINLIHLNDCIQMIQFIIDNDSWNETYNGVFPEHPIKRIFYTSAALKRGLPPPKYALKNSKNRGKRVKSKNILNNNYRFSTPLNA